VTLQARSEARVEDGDIDCRKEAQAGEGMDWRPVAGKGWDPGSVGFRICGRCGIRLHSLRRRSGEVVKRFRGRLATLATVRGTEIRTPKSVLILYIMSGVWEAQPAGHVTRIDPCASCPLRYRLVRCC
jgi:hypothetical protein